MLTHLQVGEGGLVKDEPVANGVSAAAPPAGLPHPGHNPAPAGASAGAEAGGADERYVMRLSRPATPSARATPPREDVIPAEPARREWPYPTAALPRSATPDKKRYYSLFLYPSRTSGVRGVVLSKL